jgi:dipeptidyl aminopeptidase/acylaminoacyl peptidase
VVDKRKLTSQDLYSLKFPGDPQVSPCGKFVVFTLTTIDREKNGYRTGLWIVPASGSAPARQLTNMEPGDRLVRDSSPRWSPDGSKIAFLSNRSGKEQVWILPANGGEAYRLSGMEDPVSEIAWSPDGAAIAFACREPGKTESANKDVRVITRLRYKANGTGFTDPRPRHIYSIGLETRAVNQITAGDWEDASPAWSPDGTKVAFVSCREPDREVKNWPDVWVTDLATGSTRKLTKSLGPCSKPVWSPSGESIVYVGHTQGETGGASDELFVVSVDGSGAKSLTAEFDRSVFDGVGSDSRYDKALPGPLWSRAGDAVYFLSTDGGETSVYRVPASGGPVEKVVGMHGLVVTSFDMGYDECGNEVFAYNGGTQLNPGDIFSGAPPRQLTRVNEDLFSSIELSPHDRFVYSGDQGWPIEGWIMKPAGFQEGRRYPVVVEIHGGPSSTVGEGFFFEYQLMASRGYGVFYMNFRGSRGYGEKFAKGIIGDWGGGEYRDIMAGVDHIAGFSWVDPARIYVTGGSFGGYETNWIVGHTDRFRAAVTQRSISNMYTKYGVSDIGWYGNKAGMGGADLWDQEDFIMSRSPIRYAPNVKTPILIVHSEEDLRCPMEQAEQWYVALKRLGKAEVEFVRFSGENHELSRSGKPHNRVERLERIIGWFDRHNP